MSGILFDARWIRPGMTGIGFSAYNTLLALHELEADIGIILPQGSPFAADFPRFRVIFSRIDLVDHPATELYEQIRIPILCRRLGYRNFVSFDGRVPLIHPGINTYAYIHDLAVRRIPGSHHFLLSILLRAHHRISAWSATKILTVSDHSANLIHEVLGRRREEIVTIHNADSGLAQHSSIPAAGVRKPFLVASGMTNPRKNLSALLSGFERFNAAGRRFQLVLTGDAAWIGQVLGHRIDDDVLNLGFVPEGTLRYLYENAAGFVYPSLEEGFGIPLLDASGFGCPVACSDIPAFREVMGEHAIYFDPKRVEMIAASLSDLTKRARSVPEDVVERFSWNRSARRLLEIIAASDA